MKRRDPIIEELHRVRKDIGKAHDFDVRRIAAAIRQHEDENPEGVVREPPQMNDATEEGLVTAQSCTPERVHRSGRGLDLVARAGIRDATLPAHPHVPPAFSLPENVEYPSFDA